MKRLAGIAEGIGRVLLMLALWAIVVGAVLALFDWIIALLS
jgi:hypothetical protein